MIPNPAAQCHDKIPLGAGHRDVKETSLLLLLRVRFCMSGGPDTVIHVEHDNSIELLPLGTERGHQVDRPRPRIGCLWLLILAGELRHPLVRAGQGSSARRQED